MQRCSRWPSGSKRARGPNTASKCRLAMLTLHGSTPPISSTSIGCAGGIEQTPKHVSVTMTRRAPGHSQPDPKSLRRRFRFVSSAKSQLGRRRPRKPHRRIVRQSSEILSSPCSPSSTMRILSSAEKCRRVARIRGHDEPEILPSSTHPSVPLHLSDMGHIRN
jgi:hypothetical protein